MDCGLSFPTKRKLEKWLALSNKRKTLPKVYILYYHFKPLFLSVRKRSLITAVVNYKMSLYVRPGTSCRATRGDFEFVPIFYSVAALLRGFMVSINRENHHSDKWFYCAYFPDIKTAAMSLRLIKTVQPLGNKSGENFSLNTKLIGNIRRYFWPPGTLKSNVCSFSSDRIFNYEHQIVGNCSCLQFGG